MILHIYLRWRLFPSKCPSSCFRELQLLTATPSSWWFGRLADRPTPWSPPTIWVASRSLLEGTQPAESEQLVLYLLSSRFLLHQQFRCVVGFWGLMQIALNIFAGWQQHSAEPSARCTWSTSCRGNRDGHRRRANVSKLQQQGPGRLGLL